jgi:hypothetical protein
MDKHDIGSRIDNKKELEERHNKEEKKTGK